MAGSGNSRRLVLLCGILVAMLSGANGVAAQQAAVSADVVVRLFEAGLSGSAVMNELRGRCVDFQVDDASVQQRLRAAGADDAFLQQLGGLCYVAPPGALAPSAAPTQEPQVTLAPLTVTAGGAALRSVVVPGLGQFSSGRPLVGAFFLAAGMLSESVTVYCLAQTTGECPHDQIAEEVSESKMTLGLAGFAAVAVASALEAYTGVNRVNRSRMAAQSASDEPATTITLAPPGLRATRSGVRLDLLRLHF